MNPEIKKPSETEKKEALNWPVWEKEESTFPWEYNDTETCLIIQGRASVVNEDEEEFIFGEGDYVVFPQGMKCIWKISSAIKKHYKFG